ncbi:Cofilin [Fusarium oxysporum f. sp. cubense]|uniref:Cofilin n=1 Tax=Fusarium oxysporum f. sp. cubense TaxID=61366 RepID=A0A559LQ72_FUSOC|nr:Cofilin [Fusarium oxysporum f. sp. cubense]
MSIPSGVQIQDECISAVNELRSRRDADKPRYVIYKISDNGQSVVVDETSSDKNYEAFLNKLASATDDKVSRTKEILQLLTFLGISTAFISWVPSGTSIKSRMVYASTREQLNKALNLPVSIHADDLDDIEWHSVVRRVSRGRV